MSQRRPPVLLKPKYMWKCGNFLDIKQNLGSHGSGEMRDEVSHSSLLNPHVFCNPAQLTVERDQVI